jgi:hypothetical protein
LTTDTPPAAAETRAAPLKPKRRKRRIIGIIAGVVTSATVIAFVLIAAVGALFVSGVVPLAGLQHYVASDLQKRMGPGWTVFAGKAAIVRADGHAALQIRNATFQHVSGLSLKAPDADVRYDPWSLMTGAVRISSIDLHGINLKVLVGQDGALLLDTGESRLSLPEPEGEESPAKPAASPLHRTARALAGLLDEGGILPGLDRIALTGAKLTLAAPDGDERVGFDDVSIHLDQIEGGRSLHVRGRAPSGVQDVVLTSRLIAGARRFDLALNALRLDTLERLFIGPKAPLLDGFIVTGHVGIDKAGTAEAAIAGRVRIGSGSVLIPDNPDARIKLDRIEGRFEADGELTRIAISELTGESGKSALAMRGLLERAAGNSWTLAGTATGQMAGEHGEAPQQISGAVLSARGSGLNEAQVTSLTVDGPGLAVKSSARFARGADGPEVALNLSTQNSQGRALLAAWPTYVSPMIRRLMAERVEAGLVENLDLKLAMNAEAFDLARRGEPIPDESLNVDVVARGVRFVIGDGIPKLNDVALTANSTGRTLTVQASAARIELARGRGLSLSEGSFAIADTWAARPIGRAAFRTLGDVDALASLLAMPALREAAPGQVDPEIVKGRIDLRTTLSLPLIDKISSSDIVIRSSGSIAGLASESLFGPEKLEAGNLAALYDRGALSLRGEARIGGSPAQIDLRQDAKGVGEAVVTLNVDQAMRQKRGLGFGGAVTGSAALKITKPLGRKPDAAPRFEADLTRLAIDGLLPGWNKQAGRPGRLTFTLADDDDDEGPDLNDFVLDSAPILVRGKLSLSTEGALQRASLSQFRLSPGDDMRVEMRREGGVSRLTVRGQVADARPFLRQFNAPGGGKKGSEPPPDFDIDLAVPILTGFNNEVIGNAALKLGSRGREIRQVEFNGRLGRSPISVQQAREGDGRVFRVRAEDGGAFLRYLDLYQRAYGGELAIDARPTESGSTGIIRFRDFRVRGEPALRRVIGERFSIGPDGQRVNRPGDAGNDVPFARLQAGFVRNASRIEIKEGVIWGQEIGISAQGSIDYATDRADIAGTFVPGFALNNAFAQVPLLGPLLGGGRYEGLFAVNFRIAGTASAPTMTVNPLSAIAPGILRRFIDPMGGVPLGDASR